MIKGLTDRFVAGVRCETRDNFFDKHARGLVLRVGAQRKTWYFTYRRGGATQWLRLGDYPALTLADARTRALDERHRLDVDGVDPVTARRAERAAEEQQERERATTSAPTIFTFGDFVPVFVKFQKGTKKTWRDDAAMIERYLREPWESLPLASLTRTHVHELLDTAIGAGLGVGVNRLQALISRIFTVALDRSLIAAHPAARMIKRAKERPRERVLTDDELRALCKRLDAEPGAASDALRLRLLLGQRGAETVEMQWAELDLDAATWALPSARTKNQRPHLLALPAMALAIIKKRRDVVGDTEARVFPNLSIASDDYRSLSAIPAGAYEWTDLRRTVATRLAELGFNETVIGRVLNHARYSVTGKHYNQHVYVEEIRNALTAWDTELARILANRPRARGRVVPMRAR